jgi:hypothetical protein
MAIRRPAATTGTVFSAPKEGRGTEVNPNGIIIGMKRYRPQPIPVRLPKLTALVTGGTWLLLALGPAKAEIPGHRYV